MEKQCYQGSDNPELIQEQCDGYYLRDLCVIHAEAIPSLDLPRNSSVKSILDAIINTLQYKEVQVQQLFEANLIMQAQIADLTARVETLEQ